MVLEKTLDCPLDYKEVQPVHPKGDQSWVFIGRTDAKAETPILWCSAFFTVQLSHPYMTTGKTIALNIRGMQIKTTRYHFIPIRTATVKNPENSQQWQGYGETGAL